MKRIFSALLCAFIIIFALSGCDMLFPKPKTFTYGDMSIDLTTAFIELTPNESDDEWTVAKYGTVDMALIVSEYKFEDIIESLSGKSAAEFARYTFEKEISFVEGEELCYFETVSEADGEEMYLIAFFYKSEGAFWEFIFGSSDKDREKFKSTVTEYAKSVRFGGEE